MDFNDLIRQRESVRSFNSQKPIPKDVLLRILEAGRLAPSAANKQPWNFVVVTSPDVLKKIFLSYNRQWFHDAPCVLAVTGKKQNAWTRSDGYCSIETDLAIAMTCILLAAANEGVASCWISNFDLPLLREALDLSDDEVVYAITPLGYPKDDYKPKSGKDRKSLSELVRWL